MREASELERVEMRLPKDLLLLLLLLLLSSTKGPKMGIEDKIGLAAAIDFRFIYRRNCEYGKSSRYCWYA
jgi:hypothetical protein